MSGVGIVRLGIIEWRASHTQGDLLYNTYEGDIHTEGRNEGTYTLRGHTMKVNILVKEILLKHLVCVLN